MKTLARLQQRFQDYVLHPDKTLLKDWVSSAGRAKPLKQLSVYSHAYRARLKEVMANDYPAVVQAIGDEEFNELVEAYISKSPSRYYDIGRFGNEFPEFIAYLQIDRESSWLYELAEFERVMGLAFTAPAAKLLTEQEMAAIPTQEWAELVFRFHPSLYCLKHNWNVIEMWHALLADEPTGVEAKHMEPQVCIIWRQNLITRFRSLRPEEYAMLDVIRQGENFAGACGELAAYIDENDVPIRAAILLKSWLEQGLISAIHRS